jgi:hypothetical protein
MTEAPPIDAPSPQNSWRTTLVAGSLALWLGGVAFYATVVVPAGAAVLGSHAAFGLVTRQVAHGINALGSAVALVLLLNLVVRAPRPARALWVTWILIAICQGSLFLLHPWLDALLDADTGHVVDPEGFYLRHRVYLLTTTLQWLAGAVHFRKLLLTR